VQSVTSVVFVQSLASAGFVGSVALVTSVVSVASLTALPTGSGTGQLSLVSGSVVLQAGPGIKRNVLFSAFEFPMVAASDHVTLLSGLTVAATRSIDGAAFASTANAPTSIASGFYTISLAAADLNGQTVTFQFAASGADTQAVTLVTTA